MTYKRHNIQRFTIRDDGIDGIEISPDSVPLGNDAFQYVLGSVEPGGPDEVYRRRANERGTYGGWRWETTPEKLRRRNALERDADHPIEVTRHYRAGGPGYLSAWQRAAAIGQNELFATGIKLSARAAEARARRSNPGATLAAYRSGLKEATAAQLGKLARIGLRTGHSVTQIRADLRATGRFTAQQIARGIDQASRAEKRANPSGATYIERKINELRAAYNQIERVDPDSASYQGMIRALDSFRMFANGEQMLAEIANAEIKWVSYEAAKLLGYGPTQALAIASGRKKADISTGGAMRNPRRGTRRAKGSQALSAAFRALDSARGRLLRDVVSSGDASPDEYNEFDRLHGRFNARALDTVRKSRRNPATVQAANFHPMRGDVAEGTKIIFRNGDIGILKSTMHGWVVKIDGISITRATHDANLLTRMILAIDENKIPNAGKKNPPSKLMKIAFRVDKRGKVLAYRYSEPYHGAYGNWFRIGLDEAKLKLSTGEAIEVDYDSQITSETIKRPYKRPGSEPIEDWPLSSTLVNPGGQARRKAVKLYETFSGKKAKRQNTVSAPDGTPAHVAKLGTLRLIKTADGRTWKFNGPGAPILAADHRQKLHVVGGQYRANPPGCECGEIVRIEYETDKPHLDQPTTAIYYHELGEETGERPVLTIDDEGRMHIEGGAYSIEADGIHN